MANDNSGMAQENIIYRGHTGLTGVRIIAADGELQLKFDSDDDAIQTAINPQQPEQLSMENLRYLLGILLFVAEPKKILLLGVGGGALIHYLRSYLPAAHITAVEYDPQLLQIAHEHLALPQASANLDYVIADAREFTRQPRNEFDLVLVDIFNAGISPSWLLSRSAIDQFRAQLNERGGIAYNMLFRDEKTLTGFYRQFRQAFKQQALCLESDDYENLLVYGLNAKSPARSMSYWLDRCLPMTQRYELPFSKILSKIYQINPVGSGII